MAKKTNGEPRASLRFKNPALKDEYDKLARNSPMSFNGLVELAMEIALPYLRERIKELAKPITKPFDKK